jgi:hypothetical protein
MSDPADLRASDAERERTVARLRGAAAEGRLSVEELDERSARAYDARTHGELETLLADLPGDVARATPARRAPPVDPGGIGRRPFAYVFEYPVTPRVAMKQALTTMAPALARSGYQLVARDKHRLAFDYAYRPGWVVLPVIFVPFVGLAALLVKEHDQVVVDLEAGPGGGTRLVVSGTAPRRVRRAFAELAP